MKIMIFDALEFEHYESEETFILAIQSIKARGLLGKNIQSFFNRTRKIKQFHYDEEKKFSSTVKKNIDDFHEIVEYCRTLCDIEIIKNQEVIVYDNTWYQKDILWKDKNNFYRVLWCTTA